jgi:hypothetical protein
MPVRVLNGDFMVETLGHLVLVLKTLELHINIYTSIVTSIVTLEQKR